MTRKRRDKDSLSLVLLIIIIIACLSNIVYSRASVSGGATLGENRSGSMLLAFLSSIFRNSCVLICRICIQVWRVTRRRGTVGHVVERLWRDFFCTLWISTGTWIASSARVVMFDSEKWAPLVSRRGE